MEEAAIFTISCRGCGAYHPNTAVNTPLMWTQVYGNSALFGDKRAEGLRSGSEAQTLARWKVENAFQSVAESTIDSMK